MDPVANALSKAPATALARHLRSLRAARGLTQAEVAAELDIQQQTVARWESSSGIPQRRLWPKVAAFLGVSVEELRSLLDSRETDNVVLLRATGELTRFDAVAVPNDVAERAREVALEFASSFLDHWRAGEHYSEPTVQRVVTMLEQLIRSDTRS